MHQSRHVEIDAAGPQQVRWFVRVLDKCNVEKNPFRASQRTCWSWIFVTYFIIHAFDMLSTCLRHADASLRPGLQLARIMECGLNCLTDRYASLREMLRGEMSCVSRNALFYSCGSSTVYIQRMGSGCGWSAWDEERTLTTNSSQRRTSPPSHQAAPLIDYTANSVKVIYTPTTVYADVINIFFVWLLKQTRGQSNLTKCASRGAHSPVRGHPRWSKFVPLNSWGRGSY